MAPIPSDDESSIAGMTASDSESEQVAQVNGAPQLPLEDGEEEFHTEDSDASDIDAETSEDDEDNEDAESELQDIPNSTGVPLLPENLLKHVPQSAPLQKSLTDVPWDKLTRKQKASRRQNSRKAKKQEYDRLRSETKGTGVVKAGEAARKKRGAVSVKKEKVRSGRVEKKGAVKVRMSGRQRLVEDRKRNIQRAAGADVGGAERRAKRGKR